MKPRGFDGLNARARSRAKTRRLLPTQEGSLVTADPAIPGSQPLRGAAYEILQRQRPMHPLTIARNRAHPT
jgi:hypothetical protein